MIYHMPNNAVFQLLRTGVADEIAQNNNGIVAGNPGGPLNANAALSEADHLNLIGADGVPYQDALVHAAGVVPMGGWALSNVPNAVNA